MLTSYSYLSTYIVLLNAETQFQHQNQLYGGIFFSARVTEKYDFQKKARIFQIYFRVTLQLFKGFYL